LHGSVRLRGGCGDLDRGTDFDFFDPRAHTDSPAITAAQRDPRHRLRAAMEQGGFANYPLEWWPYTYASPGSGKLQYDVPVR
jgi:D-alanyl-D-alanine dipeptidase